METSDQILQSDILGMFEARHSRSIKDRDGLLKAGVEALNTAPIDGIKNSDLAKIRGNPIGNFYTRRQGKIVFLCALQSNAMEAIDHKICADFTPEQLHALPPQEALDASGNIYHIFKLDVGTVWSGCKEALRANMALSPIERKS